MDNDDYRRGNLTCHKKYGEAIALLAGDALLTMAFNLLSTLKADCAGKVINEISDLAGAGGLIGGQVADLQGQTAKESKEKTLLYIHLNKTAKLIMASVRSGAIIGNADKTDILNLTIFAENLGYAFQISDDILDVTGTKEELGKSPGKDNKMDKLTFPSVYGIEKSKEMLCQRIDKALEILKPYGRRAAFLFALTKYIGERKS